MRRDIDTYQALSGELRKVRTRYLTWLSLTHNISSVIMQTKKMIDTYNLTLQGRSLFGHKTLPKANTSSMM